MHGSETANPLEFRYSIYRIIDFWEMNQAHEEFDKMELI